MNILRKSRPCSVKVEKVGVNLTHFSTIFVQVCGRFSKKYNRMHNFSARFANVDTKFQTKKKAKGYVRIVGDFANMKQCSQNYISLYAFHTICEKNSQNIVKDIVSDVKLYADFKSDISVC